MSAIECLHEVREIEMKLRSLDRELALLEKRMYTIRTIDYSAIRVCGGVPSDLSDRIAKFEVKRLELKSRIDRHERLRDFVEMLIEKISNEKYKLFLKEYYINGSSIEETASVIDVSREWIRKRIRVRAEREFEKLYKIHKKSWQELAVVGI